MPSSSFSRTISPFIFVLSVSSRSLVGAERWQACVCLALLSAFLMSLKHGGSAYYGDEEIQAGQKVTDLANRGPLYSSTSFSHLSFSSPLLFLILPHSVHFISLSCRVSCMSSHEEQELWPPACLSSSSSVLLFRFTCLCILGLYLKFFSLIGWSVQSSLSVQGHPCLSAQTQWGLFVALPCAGDYYCFLQWDSVCVWVCMYLCAQHFFSLSSIIWSPPFASSVDRPQSARLALKCSQSAAT